MSCIIGYDENGRIAVIRADIDTTPDDIPDRLRSCTEDDLKLLGGTPVEVQYDRILEEFIARAYRDEDCHCAAVMLSGEWWIWSRERMARLLEFLGTTIDVNDIDAIAEHCDIAVEVRDHEGGSLDFDTLIALRDATGITDPQTVNYGLLTYLNERYDDLFDLCQNIIDGDTREQTRAERESLMNDIIRYVRGDADTGEGER